MGNGEEKDYPISGKDPLLFALWEQWNSEQFKFKYSGKGGKMKLIQSWAYLTLNFKR